MARYIGNLTSDARGKVGGIVLTRARTGTTLKAHAIGVNPASIYQGKRRTIFASALAGWRNAGAGSNSNWSLLAALITYTNSLGQTYQPTGLQLWTQAWVNAAAFNTVPPSTVTVAAPAVIPILSVSLTRIGSVLDLSVFGYLGAYVGAWTASLSSNVSDSLMYTKGLRRRPLCPGQTINHVDVGPDWQIAYGPLPAINSGVSIRVVPVDPTSFVSGMPAVFRTGVT